MTQYLYGNLSNPFQVTASRSPDNTLTVYFYDDFGALYALERAGVRYYVASDHLGTPKVVTDNTGNNIRQIEYDSWGVKISDTNPGFDLPVGFAGGIPDDATGLVRFGFRDYEPGTGRWSAKDPIFFRGGLNLYVYTANDPVNDIDPSGLAVLEVPPGTDPSDISDAITGVGMCPIGTGGVIQRGGRTIAQGTAKALNETFGTNLSRREWGRVLEALKKEFRLPNDFHGIITRAGNVLDRAGRVIDNLGNYIP